MKKTILTFGLISGGMMTVMMFATLPFTDSAWLQSHSMLVGYTTIVLSFMLVFFGIRSYRENIGGGTITFGRAFAVSMSLNFAGVPIGSALSGPLLEHSIALPLLLGAAINVVAVAAALTLIPARQTAEDR